ncbi:MAG: hypothetical protein MPN21_14495 [Thermoanaerobaculia bacterium]|nr:hypothetical protein [Thermoanaerobaculia bacterium]
MSCKLFNLLTDDQLLRLGVRPEDVESIGARRPLSTVFELLLDPSIDANLLPLLLQQGIVGGDADQRFLDRMARVRTVLRQPTESARFGLIGDATLDDQTDDKNDDQQEEDDLEKLNRELEGLLEELGKLLQALTLPAGAPIRKCDQTATGIYFGEGADTQVIDLTRPNRAQIARARKKASDDAMRNANDQAAEQAFLKLLQVPLEEICANDDCPIPRLSFDTDFLPMGSEVKVEERILLTLQGARKVTRITAVVMVTARTLVTFECVPRREVPGPLPPG